MCYNNGIRYQCLYSAEIFDWVMIGITLAKSAKGSIFKQFFLHLPISLFPILP